jgi:hypothetical protein
MPLPNAPREGRCEFTEGLIVSLRRRRRWWASVHTGHHTAEVAPCVGRELLVSRSNSQDEGVC